MRVKLLRLTCCVLLCAALGIAQPPAFAQDLIARPALDSAGESWSGVYFGVGIGARLSEASWTTDCLAPAALSATCPNDDFGGGRIDNDNPAAFDNEAPRLSGYLGIDWQVSNLVLGLEGEAAWGDDQLTHAGIPGTWTTDFGVELDTARIERAWDASLRARAGVLLTPKTLVYSTGGLALMHQEVSATCGGSFPVGWCVTANSDSKSAILTGWTAGGGIERMLSKAWVVRGEYRYSDYGSRSFTLFEDTPLDSVAATIEHKAGLAYIGISRRF